MKTSDLKIYIRLAMLDLGYDPHEKLPTSKIALEIKLKSLRGEQRERNIKNG